MRTRHTITVNHDTLVKLKNVGKFGESYSELISRLAESDGYKHQSQFAIHEERKDTA